MNDIILENQLQLLMGSTPDEAEKLGVNLIVNLAIQGDKDKLAIVKKKLGTGLYKLYAQLAIDKIQGTM